MDPGMTLAPYAAAAKLLIPNVANSSSRAGADGHGALLVLGAQVDNLRLIADDRIAVSRRKSS